VLWGLLVKSTLFLPWVWLFAETPPALRPSLSHGQQGNTSTAAMAKTTFVWVYPVLPVPKHPLITNPAHKTFISKEEAGTVLGFGLVEPWVVGTGCSPRQQCFALLVQGNWHSALPSVEIHKPDYIPKHMFVNEQQLSEVSGIALIENLKSRGGKPGSGSELPPRRATSRKPQPWALPPQGRS